MQNKITVHVVDYGAARAALYMRYKDPITGKQITRTTKTRDPDKAKKEAGKWEAELQEGRYKPPSLVTWEEFRRRYEDEVVPGMADKTAKKVQAVFNAVEKHVSPAKITGLGADQISQLQAKLREQKRTETTIKSHMAHLKAALRWALRVGMLHSVPNIEMPKRIKSARHRPITREEYERMLEAVPKVVGEKRSASWKRFLTGLWWSGLRLEESMNLTWDDDRKLMIDLSGRRVMLWIPAALQKNHKNTVLPLAPEFAEMLLKVPEAERIGSVFILASHVVKNGRKIKPQQVTRTISQIGEKAGVKIGTNEKTGEAEFASAHDFRRAFGDRWSKRVMPAVLKQLMRHSSITTTMQYYTTEDAQATAELLYRAVPAGNSLGNSDPAGRKETAQEKTTTANQNSGCG